MIFNGIDYGINIMERHTCTDSSGGFALRGRSCMPENKWLDA